MHITIKYFGQIAEITQVEEESVEFSGHLVSELLQVLNTKYENLKTINLSLFLSPIPAFLSWLNICKIEIFRMSGLLATICFLKMCVI